MTKITSIYKRSEQSMVICSHCHEERQRLARYGGSEKLSQEQVFYKTFIYVCINQACSYGMRLPIPNWVPVGKTLPGVRKIKIKSKNIL